MEILYIFVVEKDSLIRENIKGERMSLTVKKLKSILQSMNDDTVITNEQNQDIVNIVADDILILSTNKPIGLCNRTGTNVYPSIVDGYTAFCPELDEDLNDAEWKETK